MSSNTTNQDDRVFHDEGLTRKLGLSTAITIGIGTSSAPVSLPPSAKLPVLPAVRCLCAFLLLGGLYQIPASMFYAEIYSAYPVSGGVYKTFELDGWRPPTVHLRLAHFRCFRPLPGSRSWPFPSPAISPILHIIALWSVSLLLWLSSCSSCLFTFAP